MASCGTAAVRLGVGKSGGAATSSEASAAANDVAAGVSISAGMTRIYIGGLGGGVTEADIEKTFGALGRVSRVDFVRSKGRAFAYIDFEPNSDKSLAKLFATYNGCIWKGGRLRLEKAKEHYLIRLKREWAEDAEPSKKPDVADMSKGFISSDKLKQMAEEKKQIQIFFPKLRKVKALPFKGTGKHKYSFQRIVIPSLPVHFCDCEEHCHPHEDPNQDQPKYVKDQTVVNEKELSFMNSVMKNLFKKEANTDIADSTTFQATEREILDDPKNETQFGDSDAAQQSDSDVDNFVTNIGLGKEEDVLSLMQLKGWDSATPDQGATFGKGQHSHEGLSSKKQNPRKRQITEPGTVSEAPCSKRAHLPSEKSKGSEFSSTAAAGESANRETDHQQRIDSPAVQSQGSNHRAEGPEIIECNKTDQNSAIGQSAQSTSWIQKSSWKELVGDSRSSMFTISHVLPSITSLSARLSDPNDAENSNRGAEKMSKPQSSRSYLKPVETEENVPVKKIAAPRHEGEPSKEEDGEHVVGQGSMDGAPRSSSRQEPKTDAPKFGLGQGCTFMRSADSLKEWSKAKTALSGQLKKQQKQQQQQQQQQQETRASEGKRRQPHRR